MLKIKLSYNLIFNSFSFYNKNIGDIFSENEKENLSKKLLKIVEYDYIIKNKKLPYKLPQNILYLIYFIGEYKKAYSIACQREKDDEEDKDTLEALGKGSANKEKLFKENLANILDKSIHINDRLKLFFENLLLLPLKKPEYKKVALLLLGTTYIYFPLLKNLINKIHRHNFFMQIALKAMEEALKFYQDTYIAKDKIINSSFIMIYTVLTQNLKMDGDKAFKHTKELVNTFIDATNNTADRYRQSYLTEKDIYLAGIYNGMPIFQWYISNTEEHYYKTEDIENLKLLLEKLYNKKEFGFTEYFLASSVLRMFKNSKLNNLQDIDKFFHDEQAINTWIYQIHNMFSAFPAPLLQYLPQQKKSFVLGTISLIIGIFTKFAELKLKLSHPKP
ncbi:hypothetical protein [Sulfurimonas sp. HSL-1716]|uniref:hypothetical protein n=1 Tax=Hydrocurvibacter sulfurireducens TaxID=3131937 RepID=UPI0031F9FBCD